jgi:hypothetical protein
MIRQKNEYAERIIDLDGQEGNAVVLLGYARGFAKDLKLDFKKIRDEMTSGDYKNLLKVFQKYFPFVILETNQSNLLD